MSWPETGVRERGVAPRDRILFAVLAALLPLAILLRRDAPEAPGYVVPLPAASAEIPDIEALHADLEDLARLRPGLCRLVTIGHSVEGRPLEVLVLARAGGRPHRRAWIQGGIHAREWMSPHVVSRLAHDLLEKDEGLLDRLEIHLLCLLNPDGFALSKGRAKRAFWRKNRARGPRPGGVQGVIGVDLNRNFDCEWEQLGSENPRRETYRGPGPASEPEVRAIQAYLGRIRFDFALDVHTGAPYQVHAPAAVKRDARSRARHRRTAAIMLAVLNKSRAPAIFDGGSAGRFLRTASAGGQAVNYFFEKAAIPTAFTVEMGSFFLDPGDAQREALVQAWMKAFRAALASF